MSWARFDDSTRRNPKVIKAGVDAATFWMWAILYSVELGTDGHLDEAVLHRIPPVAISAKRARYLAEACANASVRPGGFGLFERVDGGYRVHDFLEYQPSAEAERKRRSEASEAKSRAGKLGAARRWEKAAADGKPDGTVDGTPHGSDDGRPNGTGSAAAMAGASAKEWQSDGPDPDPDPDPEKAAEHGCPPKVAEPMSAEAKAIAAALLERPKLIAGLEHEVVRIADEHAGFMLAKGQRLRWVLDAIDECAAKTGVDVNAGSRMSRLVGFMRVAKAPRHDPHEQSKPPSTSVAQSAEHTPEQLARARAGQAEKQAKAEAALRRESLSAAATLGSSAIETNGAPR